MKSHPDLEAVLVVDDDADMRDVIACVLIDQGYQVLEASDGLEALAMADGHPELRLVISDVRMPRCDGMQLAQRLQQRKPPISVMLISGYNDIPARALESLGILQQLHKPFTLQQLITAVNRSLDSVRLNTLAEMVVA